MTIAVDSFDRSGGEKTGKGGPGRRVGRWDGAIGMPVGRADLTAVPVGVCFPPFYCVLTLPGSPGTARQSTSGCDKLSDGRMQSPRFASLSAPKRRLFEVRADSCLCVRLAGSGRRARVSCPGAHAFAGCGVVCRGRSLPSVRWPWQRRPKPQVLIRKRDPPIRWIHSKEGAARMPPRLSVVNSATPGSARFGIGAGSKRGRMEYRLKVNASLVIEN